MAFKSPSAMKHASPMQAPSKREVPQGARLSYATVRAVFAANAAVAAEGQRAERRAAPKPVRIPSGDRSMYPSSEGLREQAERRAAPQPVRIPLGDRSMYPSSEGSPYLRAAPKPARIPLGDRSMYPSSEGLQ